jgi:hypothetical protein
VILETRSAMRRLLLLLLLLGASLAACEMDPQRRNDYRHEMDPCRLGCDGM